MSTGASDDAAAGAALVLGRSLGNRWLAAAAIDHVSALRSILVGGDLFAERFIGLSPLVDWTCEIGARSQWTPQLVFDIGIARHFSGALQFTAATVGATYSVAVRPWRE